MKKYSYILLLSVLLVWIGACEKPLREIGVETTAVVESYNSCKVSGQIIDLGEEGIDQHGFCFSKDPLPDINDQFENLGKIEARDSYSTTITGLDAGTKYYVRAYVSKSNEPKYGSELSFTTQGYNLPTLSTSAVTEITSNTAVCGGQILNNGGDEITSAGLCWSTEPEPSFDDLTLAINKRTGGQFSGSLRNLNPDTKYYVKAYAVNSVGIGYGGEESFTTPSSVVVDYDGNEYQIIEIGLQKWMGENLKTKHFSNGDLIQDGTKIGAIAIDVKPRFWFDYNDLESNADSYGRLYTWHAVNDVRNICPAGWHVPSDVEWKILASNLGGKTVAGGKMKVAGTTAWSSPNTGATNESGFSALPAGLRLDNGQFREVRNSAYLWTSTEFNDSDATSRLLEYNNRELWTVLNASKNEGHSVRCIKD